MRGPTLQVPAGGLGGALVGAGRGNDWPNWAEVVGSGPEEDSDAEPEEVSEQIEALADLVADPLWVPDRLGVSASAQLVKPIAPVGVPCPAPEGPADETQARQLLHDAWARMQQLEYAFASEDTPDAEYEAQLRALCPDPDQFQSGRLQRHAHVWEEFLEMSGNGKISETGRAVLRMIRDGVQLDFVGVWGPGHESAPHRQEKLRIVKQMLGQAQPGIKPETLLEGRVPHPVRFPNHMSAEEHSAFVTAEIGKAMGQGAVRRWEGPAAPVVVNGLRVVVQPDKLRLCMNPMYINLFMRYRPLKYERITDMMHYVQPEDYLLATDDKSGYWQLAMHPDSYRYLAFEWQEEIFYWPHMPFGIAPACRLYTAMKLEVFRPLRQRSARLTFLIDDVACVAESQGQAKFLGRTLIQLLSALGFTLSFKKCRMIPAQRLRFLGFIVDAAAQAYEVPADKVAGLAGLVAELRAAPEVGMRQVARVAGKIMSMSLAVAMAPLHSRLVGLALRGKASWDAAVVDPKSCLDAAEVFLELLGVKNGRTWWRKGPALVLRVAGDASETAYSVFLPGGEVGKEEVIVPFTPMEQARMKAGTYSSTERELRAIMLSVQWLAQCHPRLVQNRRVQYQTDSMAAQLCVLGLKGRGHCLQQVADIYRQCAATDTEITVVWYPRTELQQQHADELSKQRDPSQWSLNARVLAQVLRLSSLQGRTPQLDCFADAATTVVAGRFYSRSWNPDCLGVDGLAQSWAPVLSQPRPLLYIYPPFALVGAVVRKVADERPDCILILPRWPRWWQAALSRLPIREELQLPHCRDLLVPGPAAGTDKLRAPQFRMMAYVVLWD